MNTKTVARQLGQIQNHLRLLANLKNKCNILSCLFPKSVLHLFCICIFSTDLHVYVGMLIRFRRDLQTSDQKSDRSEQMVISAMSMLIPNITICPERSDS